MSTIARSRHLEREDSFVGLLQNFSFQHTGRRSKLYEENIENLKTAVAYLTSLRTTGKLTEKDFSTLISRVCAGFVKNEMAMTIDNVLGSAVKDLKKI